MAGRVLLINHGSTLITNTLISSLKNAGIETVHVEPELEKVEPQKNGADIFLLFAGDFIYDSTKLLIYLKDLCFSKEKPLCVVGYEKELAEIEEVIPKGLIEREFTRPIDVKGLSAALSKLIREGDSRKQDKHVLLVDDDVTFLQTMQSWLAAKYRVTATKSGMQAITYIAAHTPDLILLDHDMPITTGAQVFEMIRSEPNSAKIPVIFLTGKNDRESVERITSLRPDGYLLKSMSKEDILASVDRFFETKRWENIYR